MQPQPDDLGELQTFVVQLGAALGATGEPAHTVQERLTAVARAYGADSARITAFPTYLMVTMSRDEPVTLELTAALAPAPRLDQIAALDRLLHEAERGAVRPADGVRRLEELRAMRPRFGAPQRILGYAVLTMGLCLILRPAPQDVPAAAVFGALVGGLRSWDRHQPTLQIMMPVIAAFCVSGLSALAVRSGLADAGLPAIAWRPWWCSCPARCSPRPCSSWQQGR